MFEWLEKKEEEFGQVIYMHEFFQRRVDTFFEKSREFQDRAEALHVRQGQPIDQDPYAAPLMSRARQEMEKAKKWNTQLQWILKQYRKKAQKEQAVVSVETAPTWGMNFQISKPQKID